MSIDKNIVSITINKKLNALFPTATFINKSLHEGN